MDQSKRCSKRKLYTDPLEEIIQKPSTTAYIKKQRRKKERNRWADCDKKTLLWNESTDYTCLRLMNLTAIWWLIRLPDPPIILCKSNMKGAGLGVFSNPNYTCPKKYISIPFDNLKRVNRNTEEYHNAYWKLSINKDEAWVCMKLIHNTRSNTKLYPDASFINHPLSKTKHSSPEEYMTPLGQDLRKPNCKIVGGELPHIVPTTWNGIIPAGHEWIASYGREFKDQTNKRQKQINNIKIYSQLKCQNFHSDTISTVNNDVSLPGIWQQAEAMKITIDGQELTLPKTPAIDNVASIEIELPDIKITRQWRRNHPVEIPTTAMKHSLDYRNLTLYNDMDFYLKCK